MVLSDIFSSLAIVGIAGQQTPSLLALPRRYRYTAIARVGSSLWYSFLRSVIVPLLSNFLFLAAIWLRGVDFASLTRSLVFLLLALLFSLLLIGFWGCSGIRFLARSALLTSALHFFNHRRRRVFL